MSTEISNIYTADAYRYRATNPANVALTQKIAIALGYNPEEMNEVPRDSNVGEGCGNPLAIASLKEGEIVLDIGCGGGFDVFQASRKVGPSGKVIGIDQSQDMIVLAERNAKSMAAGNVEFMHGKASRIPLPGTSVDCIISNCVFNLVPDEDKKHAIEEIERLLKPGGRLMLSDYLALKPLTGEMKADIALRAGCVGGAVDVTWMENELKKVGFQDVVIARKNIDFGVFKNDETAASVTPCCARKKDFDQETSFTQSGRKKLAYNIGEWIASFDVYGRKPSVEKNHFCFGA